MAHRPSHAPPLATSARSVHADRDRAQPERPANERRRRRLCRSREECRKVAVKGVAKTVVYCGAGAAGTGGLIALDFYLNNGAIPTSLSTRFPQAFGYVKQVMAYFGMVL